MHNLKDIRNNLDLFKKKISDRFENVNFDDLMLLDKKNREIIQIKEKYEQEKKFLSKSKDPKNFENSKKLTKQITDASLKQEDIQIKINKILSNIPNIPLDDVPVGKDENSNTVIREEGKIKNFSFKIKSHVELGELSNQIDFDTSGKLSGSRFVVLKNKIALLERALINFMLDLHTLNFGYSEISPPLLVNEEVMFGTGQLPKFEEDQYEVKTNNNIEKKYLIPTAEVVLTNLVRKSTINVNDLPKRFVASTPCFRKEAGSYGKDTKGLMRQHQFYKVELVSIVEPKNCEEELERMLNCAEEVLKLLDIPYQVVLLSTGDMGFSAEKTYDIEAWIPFENKFREISSCSSCGEFQSKRMFAKYKNKNETKYLGTLNGSALAVGRLMIALIENNQNEDGSINIPNVLKKYMNNLSKI
jgi:seryl-tRNA synthetase